MCHLILVEPLHSLAVSGAEVLVSDRWIRWRGRHDETKDDLGTKKRGTSVGLDDVDGALGDQRFRWCQRAIDH
jgi:hypothetical protein